MENQTTNQGLSYDTKTIITVLCLLVFYPAGVILMFMWMKWPTWVKTLILIPVIFLIIAILSSVLLIAVNPAGN